jgi:hypothetical protein
LLDRRTAAKKQRHPHRSSFARISTVELSDSGLTQFVMAIIEGGLA